MLCIIQAYPVEKLDTQKLKSYFLYYIEKLGFSENHLNSRINAIKFYFEQVLGKNKIFFDIPRPKKPFALPQVISQSEVIKLFNSTSNLKHVLMLKLCYGMGLRVSEIVKVKVEHIDSRRMLVLIKAAKGKKDRYVPLPGSVLQDLREYYMQYKPLDYFFEGQFGGHYSIRSVQAVFKAAMKKAKIKKHIGIHGLRHSYATHLLEAGTDIPLYKSFWA